MVSDKLSKAFGLKISKNQIKTGFYMFTFTLFVLPLLSETLLLPQIGGLAKRVPYVSERDFSSVMESTVAARFRFYVLFSVALALGGIIPKGLAVVSAFIPYIVQTLPLLPYWAGTTILWFTMDLYSVLYVAQGIIILGQHWRVKGPKALFSLQTLPAYFALSWPFFMEPLFLQLVIPLVTTVAEAFG